MRVSSVLHVSGKKSQVSHFSCVRTVIEELLDAAGILSSYYSEAVLNCSFKMQPLILPDSSVLLFTACHFVSLIRLHPEQ